ncbi:BURP domain protein RD22-like [Neltuma alba]|uniref:BURP domain protein RD22-like n=1 Tax=Neltuma alba TaxID=207710 RepID=UPI0010A2CF72|nr:BURP domain protein RD22-like [Prosopis alba]
MDALYAASVHSSFSNDDSTLTYCFSGITIMCILILCVNLVAITHAALPTPELYWKSMLPTTPMPKSIADLLHPPHEYCDRGKAISCHRPCPGPAPFELVYYGRPQGNFETKLQRNPNTARLFLEKDLKAGHKMNFFFTRSSKKASFLPRQVVKSIPFSSTKVYLAKKTIKQCEEPAITGEEKYCATSLESMLDYTIMKLGRNVQALSTDVKKKETKKQQYTIKNGLKKVGEANVVVCRKLNYVYAVLLCDKMENAVAYTVSLEGADGSTVKAVSVCHRDTSQWNPKHLAFQMLKVEPGGVPICHFLLQDSIAWVPKQN